MTRVGQQKCDGHNKQPRFYLHKQNIKFGVTGNTLINIYLNINSIKLLLKSYQYRKCIETLKLLTTSKYYKTFAKTFTKPQVYTVSIPLIHKRAIESAIS